MTSGAFRVTSGCDRASAEDDLELRAGGNGALVGESGDGDDVECRAGRIQTQTSSSHSGESRSTHFRQYPSGAAAFDNARSTDKTSLGR